MGFHLFIKDPEVDAQVQVGVKARRDKRAARAEREGVPVKPELKVTSYQMVRSGLWRELPEKARRQWEEAGRKLKTKPFLSEDR